MKLFIAGLGSGNSKLITLEAMEAAEKADIIIVPRSNITTQGLAENIIKQYLPEKIYMPVLFPMIKDEPKRLEIILSQLKPELENYDNIFFPVIGDVMLFSTGAYFLEAMRKLFPNLDVTFIPGLSAHSVAASCAKKFLALSDEIFTIISGTAEPEKIIQALNFSNAAAIYKPKAIKDFNKIINSTGPYEKIIRVDFAGIPEREKIFCGLDALNNINEYFSIILLWK